MRESSPKGDQDLLQGLVDFISGRSAWERNKGAEALLSAWVKVHHWSRGAPQVLSPFSPALPGAPV